MVITVHVTNTIPTSLYICNTFFSLTLIGVVDREAYSHSWTPDYYYYLTTLKNLKSTSPYNDARPASAFAIMPPFMSSFPMLSICQKNVCVGCSYSEHSTAHVSDQVRLSGRAIKPSLDKSALQNMSWAAL